MAQTAGRGEHRAEAVLRELGGHGYNTFTLVGDTINTGLRLETNAPVGGVLIGGETFRRLPDNVVVDAIDGPRVDGKEAEVEAYALNELPPGLTPRPSHRSRDSVVPQPSSHSS